jgi:hypothetical protein
MTRFFDIRLPIGMLCVVLGALLVGYGLLQGNRAPFTLDVEWGAVMVVFGAAMLAKAWMER